MSLLDTRPTEGGSRAPIVAAAAVLLLVASGVVSYFYLGSSEPEPPPVVATEPAATTGALRITSNVAAASVLLDGNRLGLAPQIAQNLEPGSHQVRVERFGHAPFEREIAVVAGRETLVEARLVAHRAAEAAPPAPATATRTPALSVEADVDGAQVFVDRAFVGEAPVRVDELEHGPHRVNVSAPGYEVFLETIEFDGSARTISVRFKEVSLDTRVGVVHKHGFGSCEGELRATLEGIRFETDHKDAFDVSFDRLEHFDFDYIEKNLELKIEGGRRYNFRPRSGNPDDLLVFQQQVTAARQRLAR